jgi:hypothetical protein
VESLTRIQARLNPVVDDARLGRPGASPYILYPMFEAIDSELHDVYGSFGEILPHYDPAKLVYIEEQKTFDAELIGIFLDRVISRLDAEAETDAAPPGMPSRSFPFIKDASIRAIVERDYVQVQRAAVSDISKAMLVMSGSCIEGSSMTAFYKISPLPFRQRLQGRSQILRAGRWASCWRSARRPGGCRRASGASAAASLTIEMSFTRPLSFAKI